MIVVLITLVLLLAGLDVALILAMKENEALYEALIERMDQGERCWYCRHHRSLMSKPDKEIEEDEEE